MDYKTVKHPISGETFAAEVDEDGRVVALAGPLHHSDATDEDSLAMWITNSPDAQVDAEWWHEETGEEDQ